MLGSRDKRNEVLRNGVAATAVCGATGNKKRSPKQPVRKHSIFELSFKVQQGGFGMKLADPGPRFACDVLETDPISFVGTINASGILIKTINTSSFGNLSKALPPPNSCTAPPVPVTQPNCKKIPVPRGGNNVTFGPATTDTVPTKHLCDGFFTDWLQEDGNGTAWHPRNDPKVWPYWNGTMGVKNEWTEFGPATGKLSHLYFHFDEEGAVDRQTGTPINPDGRGTLHLLSDWIVERDAPIDPDCYNYFTVQTRGTAAAGYDPEFWVFQLFGDNTVRAKLNGDIVRDRDNTVKTYPSDPAFCSDIKPTRCSTSLFGKRVRDACPKKCNELIQCAKTGWGYSFKEPFYKHQISELSFSTQVGVNYRVRMGGATRKYTCDVIAMDPVVFFSNRTVCCAVPFGHRFVFRFRCLYIVLLSWSNQATQHNHSRSKLPRHTPLIYRCRPYPMTATKASTPSVTYAHTITYHTMP